MTTTTKMTTLDLFIEYKKEREGADVFVAPDHKGFIAYAIRGEECCIDTIFVRKKFRRERVANDMADAVFALAKAKGCKFVSGFVSASPLVKGSENSLQSMLFYGFKIHSLRGDLIWLTKEV